MTTLTRGEGAMIGQCKHGHSNGVAHISCPYCRVEVLEAELAALAAPTVADTSGNCVGTSCKAEGLMKQLAAVEARIKELEEYSPPVDNIPIRYGR